MLKPIKPSQNILKPLINTLSRPSAIHFSTRPASGVNADKGSQADTTSKSHDTPATSDIKPDEAKLEKNGKAVNPKHKTQSELDAELMMKLEGISGEGGAAGLEYEDGKPVAMKRGVRDNMFRLI